MAKVRLGDYVRIRTGKLDANAADQNGKYPFFTCSIVPLCINTYSYDCECVLVAGNGDLNVKYYNGKFDAYQRTYIVESLDNKLLSVPYLYRFMNKYIETLRSISIGGVIKYIKLGNLTEASIHLPTIPKQNEIVDVLSVVDNLIKEVEQQLVDLDMLVKSRFIEMFGDPITNTKRWPADKVEAVCSNIYGGGTPSKSKEEYWNGDIPWISSKDMKSDMISDSQIRITNLGLDNSSAKLVPMNSVIMVIRSGILKHTLPVAINTVPVTVNQDLKVFIPSASIHYRFLAFLFKMLEKDILAGVRAVTADNIEFDTLKNRKIILPPVQLQNQFASFVTQVDKSKLAIQKSLDELETLKKSLMQQYFG